MKTSESQNILRRTIRKVDAWLHQPRTGARYRGGTELDQHTLKDIGVSHARLKLMEVKAADRSCGFRTQGYRR